MKAGSWKAAAWAAGWFILVVTVVHLGQGGAALWESSQENLTQAREQLRRLHGWTEVEERLASRRRELLGGFGETNLSDWSWTVLQGIQEEARMTNLQITELRPIQPPASPSARPFLRFDVKLEGPINSLNDFLRGLPEKVPGIRLNQLQLVRSPQEQRIQMLLRLDLWLL